ncbi:MAG: energy-coupling factor transporter transmembrane protein EcfT [Clostridium sp.]|jgi:energy-coupling factor transporter transmembrane protein EcfT
MEIKIKKMYWQDCITIFTFMVILWIVLAYVIINVSAISPTIMVKIIAIITGSIAGAFSTTALIAVLVHLRKNGQQLYMEDLSNYTKL